MVFWRTERTRLTGDWVRANYRFHDVVYEAAAVPLVERIAKGARRTFLKGIGVSVAAGAGTALIANNVIADFRRGAVVGIFLLVPAVLTFARSEATRSRSSSLTCMPLSAL